MRSNDRVGIAVRQPRTFGQRVDVAQRCSGLLEVSMPLLVDSLDDRVGHAYSGMPDRLYLIDRDGRVAYKGGRGPFGFKAGELEQSLIMQLLGEGTRPGLRTGWFSDPPPNDPKKTVRLKTAPKQ